MIVATSSKVTIYDGDDPDLPMWMVFNKVSTNPYGFISYTPTAIYMLNGILMSVGYTASRINFIEDFASIYFNTGYYQWLHPEIINRHASSNAGGSTPLISSSISIISTATNDVAMTVLPNAPIDDATGLPIPTIAVATDGGVSVIKDDGNVVDIRRTSDDDVHHVDFDGNRVIMFMELGAIYVATIPGTDQSGDPNSAWTVYGSYGGNTSGTDHPAIQAYGPGLDLVSMKDHTFATAGYNTGDDLYKGLSILSENLESSGNGMVAWAHTDFNTG